ncbi:hypothetical protein MKK58_15850 [Methylobacterium sp. J-078]|uniref:hypothetical protein n=1 Tax=Methylobacterium sp. J-078 TaxID=2836657 RepID=UPI001FB94944|nr:hypothetical protein [Methylobacterium sp. J-078]MCJ2045997.1 hypothetical protein [Methylobacterium sp. J-078]
MRGVYTPLIERILSLAGTVLAIGLGVWLMRRRGRPVSGLNTRTPAALESVAGVCWFGCGDRI